MNEDSKITDVTVIIPAYNEEMNIGNVIKQIQAVEPKYKILVVNDSSTDKTAEIAESAGAFVINHPYNKGNGASVKTGMRNCDTKYIVIIDGDGQHNPEDIPILVENLKNHDLVVGARAKESETLMVRNFGNLIFNIFASMVAGCHIPDLTSGFRAMSREIALEFIHMFPNGFSLPSTSTMAVITAGYNIKYVPIKIKHRKGKSKIRPLSDGIRFLVIIVRIAVYFKPLRVFLPISFVIFLMFAGSTLWYYNNPDTTAIQSTNVMLFLSSLFVFLFGLISEQIANLRFTLRK
ncbi:glycosyltransferase family 2 protein [bacterium]|nr:glycosyltransferase family 2 protein [bacterium]